MNKYQTLAANTLLISIGTFGSKLLVFLMVRFYTGYLTPAEYGTADLITQTANLLIPLASLDITEAVFRFAADRQGGREDAFNVGLRTIAIGSAGLLLVIALLWEIPAVREYGLLLATFVIASCGHALCAHFVRARGNTALFALQGLLNTALFIGLNVLFLAVFRWGVRGYVLSTTAANLLTIAVLVLRAKLWRYVRPSPNPDLRRQMLRYCIPLIPTAIFWWIMGVSDRYMVKWFLGGAANGIYAVAYKIPTILTILATVFMDAWQLSAITESSGDRESHLQFYGKIWETFASAIFLGAGGTIAFILGFYERFLDALHSLFRGNKAERKAGLVYLLKLGAGWGVGMIACVVLLSGLFAKNIYFMSSLFLGLTVCSIPFVVAAERRTLIRKLLSYSWFLFLGIAVVALTLLRTGTGALGSVNYARLSPLQFVYLFLSGAVAITAMVLPGISGSSILLIAGVYLPTIQAVHAFLGFQMNVVPGLCALGFGIIAGVGLSIHGIRTALRKYRAQTVWLILGLMFGSLYAIANGPASLDVPLPPMTAATFQFPAFALGVVILLALEFLKKATEQRKRGAVRRGESLS